MSDDDLLGAVAMLQTRAGGAGATLRQLALATELPARHLTGRLRLLERAGKVALDDTDEPLWFVPA